MAKRRRGSRTARTVPPRTTSRHRRFEELVADALTGIPMPFAEALDEVAIVIDDEPSADHLREHDMPADETLYGLYEGVARTEYAADWIMVPNRITLFRLPLEEDFPDPEDLAAEVRITVIHELAHHLGIDDDRLHALGVD